MMRLIQACVPLAFSFLMGTATLPAQQAQPQANQKPAQSGVAKPSTAQAHSPAATHGTVHKKHTRAAIRKSAKRPDYRPEYSQNSVEVINGDATRKVVFHDEPTKRAPAGKSAANLENATKQMRVEIVNGASTDTQYFYNNGEDQRIEASLNRPVVVGVQSSDTRIAGGNKHPVVTRVTASGAGDARSASEGGQPVTKSVSPHPKRPVYQP
jgi:hypothetical protein